MKVDKYLRVECILIRVHGVKPAHQGAIKPVETPTEVGDEQASIQPEHALGPWAAPNFGRLLGDMDQFLGATDFFEVDSIEGRLGLLRVLTLLMVRLE
jgi:hypothetical protein